MNINDVIKTEILSLDHQGRGIGKVNNQVIFVPNSLPGEIVEVKINNIKKKFLEGEIINFVSTSKTRIEPICPYFNICGGCDLMHMDYNHQLNYKMDKVKNIMIKYADLDCVNDIVKCENDENYRNKVTFQVDNVVGLYKKKSNEIVNIDKCLLVDDRINKYLDIFKTMDLEGINQIVVKVSFNDTMIIFYCEKNIDIDINLFDCNLIKHYDKKYITLKGNNYIVEKIGDLNYKISPTSFFQVNSKQVLSLYNLVKRSLSPKYDDIVLDLYCGTGTIGLYIANAVKEVIGIEINEEAIKDANFNKELNNIFNIKFMTGDTGDVLKKHNFKPNKVIVDPPRAGLDKKAIEELIKIKADLIVYVSCDPLTLARDLKILGEYYCVESITPVDMFPNTFHIENVCILKIR